MGYGLGHENGGHSYNPHEHCGKFDNNLEISSINFSN